MKRQLKPKYDRHRGVTFYLESVPAPDELQEELRRVRETKEKHIKAQNYQIAALYREIEKLLTEKIEGSNPQE